MSGGSYSFERPLGGGGGYYVDEDKICIGSYDLKFVWVCYAMGRYNSLPMAFNIT